MSVIKWNNVGQLSGAGADAYARGVSTLRDSLQGLAQTAQDQGDLNTENYNRQSERNDDQIADLFRSYQNPEEFDTAKQSGAFGLDALRSQYGNQFDVSKANTMADSTRGRLVQQDSRQDQDAINKLMTQLNGSRDINAPADRAEIDQVTALTRSLKMNPQDTATTLASLRQQQEQSRQFTNAEETKYNVEIADLQATTQAEKENTKLKYEAAKTELPVDKPLTEKQEKMSVESVLNNIFKTEDGKDSSYKAGYLKIAKKGYVPEGAPEGTKPIPVPGHVFERVMQGLSFEGETGAFWSKDYRIDGSSVGMGMDFRRKTGDELLQNAINAEMKVYLGFEKNRAERLELEQDFNANIKNINERLLTESAKIKANARQR